MQDLTEASEGRSRGLRVFARAVRMLADLCMVGATLLILMDLCLVGFGVLMRYVFAHPLDWTGEVVSLSLSAVVMLAAPRVLLAGGHVEVDILTGTLKGRARLAVRIWSGLAVLAVAALLIGNGWKTVMLSKMIGQVTDGSLELPIWMLQLLLPFGGAMLGLCALSQIWTAIDDWGRAR
ncbi:TRAP transporter small permease [Acidimangrovimonas pyrenivorans]|uniref:TRAP transporter small permease protein n=1 Tax=Acidimangrovimonas pyrenivorans TaxID=2030798 RepID=A0ABV7AGA9_9RHOB